MMLKAKTTCELVGQYGDRFAKTSPTTLEAGRGIYSIIFDIVEFEGGPIVQ